MLSKRLNFYQPLSASCQSCIPTKPDEQETKTRLRETDQRPFNDILNHGTVILLTLVVNK